LTHEPSVALPTALPPDARARVRRNLAAWFARHARALPWRQSADAYRIWISEVMLQQTQVASVIPYFERFLQRFPDVATLAGADEQETLRLWEGLGYYRRARDLHRAARLLVLEHAGAIPCDAGALRRLPGFGRYTVNAVLSQAFDQRLPILEANSRRVLCRLLGVRGDPRRADVDRALWQAAELLLPRCNVGKFNQALMELGALVCKPDAPGCSRCPVRRDCFAQRHQLQQQIPASTPRPEVVQVAEVAVVLARRGRLLLVQRPPQGRWGSLWEFPRSTVPSEGTAEVAAARLLAALGFEATVGRQLLAIRHSVTRFRISLTCVAAHHRRGSFIRGLYPRGEWLRPAQLRDYPLSTPQRRLAQHLLRDGTVSLVLKARS
jgi:A/G-specific adenine glycosylase